MRYWGVSTDFISIFIIALGLSADCFAVTLAVGIITSMFTAVMVTRAIVNLIYGRKRRLSKLAL